ncbi:hypothetical protein A2291_02775 [candidate division WOR-1 bacterium RIFOXYB2_FULL_42_35]|uniref:Uncharacterized protein n=1 Tax=candidate division WOR-1 bacterium RIFOXYC2_FULL_41_25 TaxID=1802586 RepID=A0A1F4TMP8_UNCSA|nr:MAG: hypothetical protein A2247_04905 [candidate division WOR-1 bacterium RIFOXYA2_FULL_41_14]OGC23117.1 MAG: hypothetical protein A2291_02775 [candidate division WOR-1 bacterium RIFOXYB2_FULL_42_35]OGC33964.1 MAG: hypothetical protein A2462_07610 [candidate division WOR-1 bacterium RIFOXYC2_FULL_41_25]OGC42055.1 MAG: hypothetical protein A2548_04215 [candidate division WOR-1 bacterium RIFOXYD2_FULL_41_8]
MADKKKIKNISSFESYENRWEVTFADDCVDEFSKRIQTLLKATETKDQDVEFLCGTYRLDKNDVQKLQGLA